MSGSGTRQETAEITSKLAEHGLALRGGVNPDQDDADAGHDLFPQAFPGEVDTGSPFGNAINQNGSGRRAKTILLVGVEGRSLWPHLERDAQFQADRSAGATNALDAWSERKLRRIAGEFGAAAVFPNDRPYRPFQRWALRSGTVFQSPIGMLIDPKFGLWHAYRGALLFEEALDLPPRAKALSPCESCDDKPCLTACPVGAFTEVFPGEVGTGSPSGNTTRKSTDDPMRRYDVAACAGHLATDEGRSCLTGGCAARNACPVGREHRYEPDQMRFHMAAFARARGVEA